MAACPARAARNGSGTGCEYNGTMPVSERAVRRVAWRRSRAETAAAAAAGAQTTPQELLAAAREPAGALEPETSAAFEIAPNDPLVAYFQGSSGAVDITALDLDSPALAALR